MRSLCLYITAMFISAEDHGEVIEVNASSLAVVQAIALDISPGPDSELNGRGVPNYIINLTISPDGRRIWIPYKKDNTERGLSRDGLPLTFENTVRTIVSQIDLTVASASEILADRLDLDNRDFAIDVAFSPSGDYVFVALQGSNAINIFDAYTLSSVHTIEGVGRAPHGMVINNDGTRLFAHSFLSRSVLVYDLDNLINNGGNVVQLTEVSTVSSEKLSSKVLQGKRIFYNANDPRMNSEGYISCATCHLDGAVTAVFGISPIAAKGYVIQ